MTVETRDIMVEDRTVTVPGPYENMAAFRQNNREAGFYFFSKDTMEFFDSRIERGPIVGRFFVTSEQAPRYPDGTRPPRTYNVRCARDDGRIISCGPGIATGWPTVEDAVDCISEIRGVS